MTPRGRELLGNQISEEQVAYWESQGLGYPGMMCLVGNQPADGCLTNRALALEVVKLAWLRLQLA